MKVGAGTMFIVGSALVFPANLGKQASGPETLPPLVQKMGSLVKTHPMKTSNGPSDELMVHFVRNQLFIGCWATEDILVAATPHDCVQSFDTVTHRELWHRRFATNVYSVTASDRHVFVAVGNRFPADRVVRLDLRTGEETTPAGTPQSLPAATLEWSAGMNALWVLHRGGLRKYSADLVSLAPEISGCGSLLPESSPYLSCAGRLLLVAERSGLARLVDPDNGTVRKIEEGGPGGTDAPTLENAFAAPDGRLIWAVHSGWRLGGISFQPGPDAAAKAYHSLEGKPVSAVHWGTDRLAVIEGARNLSIISTEGKVFQRMADIAPRGGVGSLVFSPSGRMLAVLTYKGIQFFECP